MAAAKLSLGRALVAAVTCVAIFASIKQSSVTASGVFEVNLASLVTSAGRDLREECCNWQKQQYQQQQQQQQTTDRDDNDDSQQQQLQPLKNHKCDQDKCQLFVRICVKYYQTTIDPSQCTFGELSAQVLHPKQMLSPMLRNSIHHHNSTNNKITHINNQQHAKYHQHSSLNTNNKQQRSMKTIVFNQPIQFPFNFTWPDSFSLIIEAWYELAALPQPSPQATIQNWLSLNPQQLAPSQVMLRTRSNDYPLQQSAYLQHIFTKQVIIKSSMHGFLSVKHEWTSGFHKTEVAELSYAYRVTCQQNYYGSQCAVLCKPRDDAYGHYSCSQNGEIQCLNGWHGAYCSEPTCSLGCHPVQGNCSRPNECNCRYGWQGPTCDQCVRYPGCVHGSCNKPHECICQEGWGGLLCNEDLNYCTNHRPCKNDALCTNSFNDGSGSYTCTCADGFVGKNCEKKIKSKCNNPNDISACKNGAECYEVESSSSSSSSSSSNKDLYCSCASGFSGKYCESLARATTYHNKNQISSSSYIQNSKQQSRNNNDNSTSTITSSSSLSSSSSITNNQKTKPSVQIISPSAVGFRISPTNNKDVLFVAVSSSDNCLRNPCKNGGICVSMLSENSFRCDCKYPFDGSLCETFVDSLSQISLEEFEHPNSINSQIKIRSSTNKPSSHHAASGSFQSNQKNQQQQQQQRSLANAQAVYHPANHQSNSVLQSSGGQIIGLGFTLCCLLMIAVLYVENFVRKRRELEQNRIYSSYVEDVTTLQNQQNTYRTTSGGSSSSQTNSSTLKSQYSTASNSSTSKRSAKIYERHSKYDECDGQQQVYSINGRNYASARQLAGDYCTLPNSNNNNNNNNSHTSQPPPAYHYHSTASLAAHVNQATLQRQQAAATNQQQTDSSATASSITTGQQQQQQQQQQDSINTIYGLVPNGSNYYGVYGIAGRTSSGQPVLSLPPVIWLQ